MNGKYERQAAGEIERPIKFELHLLYQEWHHYRLSLSSTDLMQTTQHRNFTPRIVIVIPAPGDQRQCSRPATTHSLRRQRLTISQHHERYKPRFVSMLHLHARVCSRKMFTTPSTTRNSGMVACCDPMILARVRLSSAESNSYRYTFHQQIVLHSLIESHLCQNDGILLSRHLMFVFKYPAF